MRVPVAVYRWFEQGGAWAYDPLCASILGDTPADELDVIFDRWLKRLSPGSFTTTDEKKREWVFLIERDGDALDPRAREGETHVLRAVLLPRLPGERQRGRLEELLRKRNPQRPGVDPSLVLDVGRDVLPRHWGCALVLVAGIVMASRWLG
jgi:hypothetical protein